MSISGDRRESLSTLQALCMIVCHRREDTALRRDLCLNCWTRLQVGRFLRLGYLSGGLPTRLYMIDGVLEHCAGVAHRYARTRPTASKKLTGLLA
jgi:hypothetical protein